MEFFEKEDIDFYTNLISTNQKYRKSDAASQQSGLSIKKNIFAKTNYWAKLVAAQLPDFTYEEDNIWNQSGNFKKYSWARLYLKGYKDKKYYVTVGVYSIDNGLYYKFDCQREGAQKLDQYAIDKLDDFLKSNGIKRQKINADQVDSYNWNSLTDATVDFINQNLSGFKALHENTVTAPDPHIVKKPSIYPPSTPLNQILYGPPGTGKTYNTIELAVELITGKKDASHSKNKETFELLKKEGQIEFITFHQNYAYEDLVVGIKPDLDNANLKFRKNEGIFYQICDRAKANYYQSKIPASNISLQPFEEVYEAYFSPLLEDGEEIEVTMKSGKILKVIEINGTSIRLRYPSGSEEHTMNMATLKKAYDDREAFESKKIITGGMYTYYKPVLERLWEMGKQTNVVTPLRNYVLIIDEINRANISRVFGELITLLEEDKRLGSENELKLTLPNGEQDFALPPNLYILGTMNTADKSIALVDIALRRRFEFRGFYPTKSAIDKLATDGKLHVDVPHLLAALNKKIFDKKGADFLVGHAYFINKITDQDLFVTLKRKVVPLLMEYFAGKIDIVRELFSNSGYSVTYDTDNYDWTIAKA